jgi:hypothetical protein
VDLPSFHRLHSLVIFEIGSFEGRLKQLSADDYPTDTAPSFIKLLLTDLADQRKRISQIVSDLPHDEKGAFARLRSEHRKLVLQFQFVNFLQNAQTRRVPWSLVPTLERFADRLLPGKRLLTFCSDKFNYSIQWSRSSTPAASKSGLESFYLLMLPAIHRLNPFLHVLVGHELFHPLLNDFLDHEQSQVVQKLRSSCVDLVSKTPSAGPLFEKERLDRTVELLRTIWRRAMEELICDLGCAAIFGPAAIFASVSLFLGSDIDAPPVPQDYYPPPRYRLRKTIEHAFGSDGFKSELEDLLSELGSAADLAEWLQCLKDQWKLIDDLTKDALDLTAIDGNPAVRLAYDQIDDPLRRAWAFVKDLAKSKEITWTESYREVPSHVRSLKNDVPCGEFRVGSDPCGAASSVNAIALSAWINELHGQAARLAKDPNLALEEYLRSCRIFLKSLEDSELKRVFVAQIPAALKANT